MAVQRVRWRFSVTDYARMLDAGILTEDDRVELIAGEVRAMSPIGPLHSAIVKRLNALLTRQLAETAIVGVQDPVQLSEYSQPQPDVAVLRWRDDYYAHAHPTAADVLLVVEVADSSLSSDRGEKLPLYAEAGIPEVWIIDVAGETLEQHTGPTAGRYVHRRLLGRSATLTTQLVTRLQIPLARIFD